MTPGIDSLETRGVVSGWRVVVGVAAAMLLAAGVVLLVARAAGFSEVWDAVRRADSTWFVACLAAQALALAAYTDVVRGAFAWHGRPDPGYALSVRVLLAGIGAMRVFAAAGVGAIAAMFWCFRRAGFSSEIAIARVLGVNVLFYVSFGIGAWFAALLTVTGAWGKAPLGLTGPWLVLVPVAAVAALVVTQRERVDRLTTGERTFFRRALAIGIAALAWVRDVLRARAGRRLLASTVLYWVGSVACLWAALQSVGEALPLPELLLAFAVGQAALLLPLPLGGVGGIDAALTYALTAVGVPLAPALVAVGVYRLFAFWAPTIPALAALVLLPSTGARLARLRSDSS